MERRQLGQRPASGSVSSTRLERGQHAPPSAVRHRQPRRVDGHLAGHAPTMRRRAGPGRRTSSGPTARRPRPTRAGSPVRRRTTLQERRHRRQRVGDDLPADRHDRCSAARVGELARARAERSSASPPAAPLTGAPRPVSRPHPGPGRAAGRSSSTPRCGRRRGRPGRRATQERVAVAVDADAPAPTAGRRTSPPCTRTPGGCGSRTRSGRSR